MALVDRSLEKRLEPFFVRLIARRWLVVAVYSVVVAVAAILASDIPRDNSLENMVVSSDPEVAASHEFEGIFPDTATVFLMLETDDPFTAGPLTDLERLEAELGEIAGVSAFSIATVWRRSRPGAGSPTDDLETFRELVGGSDFFRRQGLIGDGFLAVVLALDAPEPEIRDRLLEEINEIVFAVPDWLQSIDRVRRVGRPWIDAWLEHETTASSVKYFPLFAAFIVSLILGLYRSWRALAVILLSLGVAVLLGMAFAGLVGLGFTIVSALVPLTLMVTATASLVYLHSRFVDQPSDVESGNPPDSGAGQQVCRGHGLGLRRRRRLRRADGLEHPADPRARHLDLRRPPSRLGRLLHPLSRSPDDLSCAHATPPPGGRDLGRTRRRGDPALVLPLALAVGPHGLGPRYRRSDRAFRHPRRPGRDATRDRRAGLH